MIALWFRAFLLTTAIEVPIVLWLTREVPLPAWRRGGISFFGQCATHPMVWFVFPYIVGLRGRTALTLSELWAWLGEAALYFLALPGLRPLRAVGIAGVANGASFALGLLLFS